MTPLIAQILLFACTAEVSPTDEPVPDDSDVAAECPDRPTIAWLAEPGGEPLVDGDSVVLEHGPQGGWHIGVTAGITGHRILGLHPFVELVSTGQQLAGDDNAFELPLSGWSAQSCEGTMAGMIAYLDDPGDIDQAAICALVGESMRVKLVVTDPGSGVTAEREVQVVATADPDDVCE